MRHFATESGKSKGQFYTSAEVSRIMAKVIASAAQQRQSNPLRPDLWFCWLLLKAHDEARGNTGLDITIYGQEMDTLRPR